MMQRYDAFSNAAQHAPAGPALDALNEWAHVEGPILGVPVAEILRQLASSYMDNSDSQVHMCYAPGWAQDSLT